jgi:hypothetical protein
MTCPIYHDTSELHIKPRSLRKVHCSWDVVSDTCYKTQGWRYFCCRYIGISAQVLRIILCFWRPTSRLALLNNLRVNAHLKHYYSRTFSAVLPSFIHINTGLVLSTSVCARKSSQSVVFTYAELIEPSINTGVTDLKKPRFQNAISKITFWIRGTVTPMTSNKIIINQRKVSTSTQNYKHIYLCNKKCLFIGCLWLILQNHYCILCVFLSQLTW